jgi:hypothetical protein
MKRMDMAMRLANWKRFSLRTLFVLMTACCLVFGIWSAYVNPYRMQYQSQGAVARLRGRAVMEVADGPRWQRWLVTRMLGENAFVHVTSVELAGQKTDDQALQSLAGLTHLKTLALADTRITDDGIAALRPMKQLTRLSLRYADISDGAVPHLNTLPALETVFLTGTNISDAAIPELAKHRRLSEIFVRWTRITNAGAERLSAAMPDCSIYHHALVEE